ncbi:hypothetical protein CK203_063052 [Vitis vinifera]|uniref:Uncharacterized protein n=1 Tax=Vitis vinifera TaxID=29760 RepID=A0A438G5J6_VITVI|nr:hypothetical protein CK203_063052 [Vitis vinifera]
MSSSLLLMEPLGGSFGRFLPTCRTACAGKHSERSYTMGVVATSGLGLPDSCGPSLARIVPDNWGLLSRCLLLRNELSLSFPHEELALSLLPGLLNVDDWEAPSMKPVCATQCFILLILLSPGGELAVVARLLTVDSANVEALRPDDDHLAAKWTHAFNQDRVLVVARAIITLRAANRDRGRRHGCQRSWEVTCHHSCPFALQVAERGLWQAVGMT